MTLVRSKSLLYVLFDGALLGWDLRHSQFWAIHTLLVAEKNFGVTKVAFIFRPKDILQAALVHVVLTLFEFETPLPVVNFEFAKDTVDFGIVEIFLWWLECLFEALT